MRSTRIPLTIAIALVAAGAASAANHGQGRPDLIVRRVTFSPASLAAGGQLKIHDRRANTGSSAAGRTTVGYYLVATGAAKRRIRLGGGSLGRLRPGGAPVGVKRVAVPAAAAGAGWRVLACADDLHRVRERREHNNCRAAAGLLTVRALDSSGPPGPTDKPPDGGGPGPSHPPDPKPVTLTSPADGALLDDRTPSFEGTAGPNAPVTVAVYSGTTASGTPVETVQATPANGGAWSTAASPPLADGQYTARAGQGSGANPVVSSPRSFTIDATAPAVSIADPLAGSTTSLMAFSGAAGTATGDSGDVTVRLYSGAQATGTPLQTIPAAVTGDSWSAAADAGSIQPGAYTLEAAQDDQAGNAGRATSTFTVPVTLLAAGDIAGCDTSGDSATASLLSLRAGTIAALGDNAYEDGTTQPYEHCYDPTWGPFKARTAPSPGNHEYNPPLNGSDYYAYFGAAAGDPTKGYYSYELGSWHVVVLNTNRNCGDVSCSTASPQELWLKTDLLAQPSGKCILAYFHHPQFSSYLDTNATVQPLWQDLADAGAEVILNGHSHNYERFAPQSPTGQADAGGLQEIVVGTGGESHHMFPTTFAANSQAHDDATFGILELTLGEGQYSWQFVPVGGGSFTDAGTASCH